MFSVVAPVSYANIKSVWVPELESQDPPIPILLVGTKIDLRGDAKTQAELAKRNQSVLSSSDGEKLASEIRAIGYHECSAWNQEGLKSLFEEACHFVLKKRHLIDDKPQDKHKKEK